MGYSPWGHKESYTTEATENTVKTGRIKGWFLCIRVSLVAQLQSGIHLQCGRPGFNPWVGTIPWRRERLPTPVFWPGELRGLDGPWSHKELDTTE